MNCVILVKVFYFGVFIVGFWVILVVIYLLNCQEIFLNVMFIFGISDKLLIFNLDIYNIELDVDIKFEVIFYGLNRYFWDKFCQSSFE